MRGKPMGLIIVFLLPAFMVGSVVWLIYAQERQKRLDRALIAAIQAYDTRKALELLEEGADSNARDEAPEYVPNEWPHHLSPWQQFLNLLRGKRLPAPAAPTALVLACSQEYVTATGKKAPDNVPLVKALLDRGAATEVIDHGGIPADMKRTPLLWATLWNKTVVSTLLIERGANVNVADGEGDTPLWWAAANNNGWLVGLLISKGAHINVKARDGSTPLKLAKNWENQTIIQRLKQAGAKE